MPSDGYPDASASVPPLGGERSKIAAQLLQARGAHEIAHLNGTLIDHLERTELLLRRWGCSEVVSTAGLCHAVYGTDGFTTALLTLEDRGVLARLVGDDVEALVYLYAACDRGFTYPRLCEGRTELRDRFSGEIRSLAEGELRDFVDVTLANEVDVGIVGSRSGEPPEWLLNMFDRFEHFASASVRAGFRRITSTTSTSGGRWSELGIQ